MWSGAAYCQLFHVLFPKSLNLDKVSGLYIYFFSSSLKGKKTRKCRPWQVFPVLSFWSELRELLVLVMSVFFKYQNSVEKCPFAEMFGELQDLTDPVC